jgi:hypothetical protein
MNCLTFYAISKLVLGMDYQTAIDLKHYNLIKRHISLPIQQSKELIPICAIQAMYFE